MVMATATAKYRLFESTGYLYPDLPALAESDDRDALAAWAVRNNDWQGIRTVAVIVSDEGRFWKLHRGGSLVEIDRQHRQSGGVTQVDRYVTRLARDPSPGDHRYKSPPRIRWQHTTVRVP